MNILKKILGFPESRNQADPQASAGLALLGVPSFNPFPKHRVEINRQHQHLSTVAASGNDGAFDKALAKLSSELTLYNSNVGRLVVTPVKAKFTELDQEHINITRLHKLHIRHCGEIRKMCTEMRRDSSLLASGNRDDSFLMLDAAQTEDVSESLIGLGEKLVKLEKIWMELEPFEKFVYKVKN